MNEQKVCTAVILITCFIFWLIYELKNPEIEQDREMKYDVLFQKDRNTGKVKIRRYFFNKMFLQIIVLNNTRMRKYYYFRNKKAHYKKYLTTNKLFTDVLPEKETEQKSN